VTNGQIVDFLCNQEKFANASGFITRYFSMSAVITRRLIQFLE